jgi:guanine nucleotide-binding protein subunit alpha
MIVGIWGTVSVGLFSETDGFFTGHNLYLTSVQILGIVIIITWTVTCMKLIYLMVGSFMELRVEGEIETAGCDVELMGGLTKVTKDVVTDLMSRDETIVIFRAFLRSKGSEELLDFFISARDLEDRDVVDSKQITKIYKTYVEPGAPREINVPSWILENINIQLNYHSPKIFSEAQSEVYDMLERLVLTYFEESESFQDYIEEKESRRAKPICHWLAESDVFNPKTVTDDAAQLDAVENQLRFDKLKEEWTFQILLLGCGEGGKSTFYKQVRNLYKNQMDIGIIKATVSTLRENVRDCIQRLAKYATDPAFIKRFDLGHHLKLPDSKLEMIMQMDSSIGKYNETTARAIKEIWDTPLMQESYEQVAQTYWILENTPYYMEHAERYATNFSPTNEDLLRARLKTTGIACLEFFHSDNSWCKLLGISKEERESMEEDLSPYWKVIDVGGQRSERRKWLPYLDAVQGCLFFINAHGYRVCLYEDVTKLRMHEDMGLFQDMLGKNFKTIPVTVLFTKEDLFHANFSVQKFMKCFPEFGAVAKQYGGEPDSKIGMKFMTETFNNLAPKDRKYPVKFMQICTFEVASVRHAFSKMQNQVLEMHQMKILQLCGLIETVNVDGKGGKSSGLSKVDYTF